MESEGKIYLTSGGYTDGRRSERLDGIIEYNATQSNVLIIDNATTTQSNEKGLESVVFNFNQIAKKVDVITLNESNCKDIFNYDVIYIISGDVYPLIELAKSKDVKNALYTFVKNGGVIFSDGLGSTIFGKDLKWYYNIKQGTKPRYDVSLESYKGFGFVDINFYPHWDKTSAEIKEKALSYAKDMGKWLNVVNDGEFIEVKFSSLKYTVIE